MSEQARSINLGTAVEWWVLSFALACSLAALVGWRWQEYVKTDEEQRQRLQFQARDLGGQMNRLMVGIDRVVGLAMALPASGVAATPPPDSHSRLRILADASVAIRELKILNEDGSIQASSSADADHSLIARQPCYERARSAPASPMLHICSPFRNHAGAWAAGALRARPVKNGGFGGVVFAKIDLDYLDSALPSALYAEDMRAFLTDAEGVVVASAHADVGLTGRTITGGPDDLLARFRASHSASAVVEGLSNRGRTERIVAFQSIQPAGLAVDRPLLLSLSRGREAVYHDWHLTTWLSALAWLLAASAGAAALHRVQRVRLTEADAALARRRNRLAELERIELIVGGADISLWVWHARERRLEVDARWCEMVGCPADDLVAAASTWRARIHRDDAQTIRRVTQEQMLPGQVAEFEYRIRHDAGHWVWLLTRGKVVERDAAHAPVRFAGTHLDITDRKQIEQALKMSEESLSTTLESIGDAVIATDAHGRITRMNATAAKLTGCRVEEAQGKPLTEVFRVVHSQSRAPAIDPVQRVLSKPELGALDDDTLLLSLDGSERRIANSAAPIRSPSGAITGVVLVFSDVTDQYRVQRALRESESQMRLVTNAMPAAIGRFDAQLRFLFVNKAYELILGQPASALIGRTFEEVFGAAAAQAVAPWTQRVNAGERVSFEETFDTPVLGRRQALVNMVPDFDIDGTVRGHFSITTDMTDLRALEEHLRESQKMDSIGTLAGGIAHDFNNVLGAVIGNAELALERLHPGHPARANLEQVRRASHRARGLVQQILTFSRRQPEQLVTLPLQPLLEETLAILRSTLPARVDLATEIALEPLYVNADATQIQQVLMNLGTNAWHALGSAPGHIVVGMEGVSLGAQKVPGLVEGRYAHLWVSDDGMGIDATTRHRIFEPFFTTKPIGEGTGLGLSVVHGIVRTHLGAITLDTVPGEGTTFHVYLPATPRPSQVGALDEAAARAQRGHGQHVMYVDDDEVMMVMVDELLVQAGYRVTACQNAKDALAAFIEAPRAFDLVVTDFNMPDFSGLELAEEMVLIRPDLPVVISSGYVSEELRAGAQRVG